MPVIVVASPKPSLLNVDAAGDTDSKMFDTVGCVDPFSFRQDGVALDPF